MLREPVSVTQRPFSQPLCSRPLRVCLVRPPTLTSASGLGQDAVPPLGLAYIAGAVRAVGHEVCAVDAVGAAVHQYSRVRWSDRVLLHGLRIEEIVGRIDPQAEVIGVSCMFSVEWPVAVELLAAIRSAFPRALIVLGGEHVTACPEFTLTECPADIGVLGEGEETIVELLQAHAAGCDPAAVAGIAYRSPGGGIARTAPRARIRAIDDIPPPDWTRFPVETYIDNALTHGANLGRCMPILASRGCPYQCTFCSSPLMWTTRWSARRPDAVLAEMKEYIRRYRVTNFDFYDLTAIVKKSWIVDFCRLLIAERLGITWQLPSGTRSEAIDEEVAQLLHASGCRIISYAPESGSRAELARIKKRVDPDRVIASMRGARRAGLTIKTNLVFGFPGSAWRDVLDSFRFLARLAVLGVDDVNVFPFSPYPGSELFEQLLARGELRLDTDYFRSLLAFNDPEHSVSYTDFVGSRGLSRLNLAAMGFFYALNFSIRPQRAAKLAWALVAGDTSTRLTMALAHRRRRRLAMRVTEREGSETVVIPSIDEPRPVIRSGAS
jgi:anaerobic magnesium-protoporphyrin IX monomethyl ester cyclase